MSGALQTLLNDDNLALRMEAQRALPFVIGGDFAQLRQFMGAADDDSVVDPLTMKVWGTEGLRVCDASAMRYVTNGNIYAPVMMMAEKAADLILGNAPLPPDTAPFYRAT